MPNLRLPHLASLLLSLSAWALLAAGAEAQVKPTYRNDPFHRIALQPGRLAAHESVAPWAEVEGQLAPEIRDGWAAFLLGLDGEWRGYADQRTGLLEYAEGAGIPWIPGRGNQLTAADLAAVTGSPEVHLSDLEKMARTFLGRVGKLLGVDPAELVLNAGRSGQAADYLWFVDFDLVRSGRPVEGARVSFTVNNGNLIQFGTVLVPPADVLAPEMAIERDKALSVLSQHVGGFTAADRLLDPGSLHLLPVDLDDSRQAAGFAPGHGRGLVLTWDFTFKRERVMGTWRGRVDATTGELLAFSDINRYAQVTGGVYPESYATDTEVVRPMPFASINPSGTSDSAGYFTYSGGAVSSSLIGPYVKIHDFCGDISKSGNGSGFINFGLSSGTDCVTPGFGGLGNTHAARMQFYQVNRIKEAGRGWLPSNSWLSSVLPVNVNLSQTCNAYWDGSSLNFFLSGGGCGNTGEIAGVSLHEYGHGLDQNDGGGDSPDGGTAESYADTTATLITHDSCSGKGFL
ncbi:MAG TPA: hypothetical protein VMM92_08930, partial [Thermoanaerobaculia bacterium]|nr:hypothetical protein [Thermoanaerobaculia bacterium]